MLRRIVGKIRNFRAKDLIMRKKIRYFAKNNRPRSALSDKQEAGRGYFGGSAVRLTHLVDTKANYALRFRRAGRTRTKPQGYALNEAH